MESTSLTTAFVTMQLLLLAIVFVGVSIIRHGEPRPRIYSRVVQSISANIFRFLTGFTIISLGMLLFTEDILSTSRPVFGDFYFPGLPASSVFLCVFLLNLAGSMALIVLTGGSVASPFSPIMFLIPTLAIFLRESPTRFLSYAFLAGILFLVARPSISYHEIKENNKYNITFNFVAIGCLFIGTIIGYITRPVM